MHGEAKFVVFHCVFLTEDHPDLNSSGLPAISYLIFSMCNTLLNSKLSSLLLSYHTELLIIIDPLN